MVSVLTSRSAKTLRQCRERNVHQVHDRHLIARREQSASRSSSQRVFHLRHSESRKVWSTSPRQQRSSGPHPAPVLSYRVPTGNQLEFSSILGGRLHDCSAAGQTPAAQALSGWACGMAAFGHQWKVADNDVARTTTGRMRHRASVRSHSTDQRVRCDITRAG